MDKLLFCLSQECLEQRVTSSDFAKLHLKHTTVTFDELSAMINSNMKPYRQNIYDGILNYVSDLKSIKVFKKKLNDSLDDIHQQIQKINSSFIKKKKKFLKAIGQFCEGLENRNAITMKTNESTLPTLCSKTAMIKVYQELIIQQPNQSKILAQEMINIECKVKELLQKLIDEQVKEEVITIIEPQQSIIIVERVLENLVKIPPQQQEEMKGQNIFPQMQATQTSAQDSFQQIMNSKKTLQGYNQQIYSSKDQQAKNSDKTPLKILKYVEQQSQKLTTMAKYAAMRISNDEIPEISNKIDRQEENQSQKNEVVNSYLKEDNFMNHQQNIIDKQIPTESFRGQKSNNYNQSIENQTEYNNNRYQATMGKYSAMRIEDDNILQPQPIKQRQDFQDQVLPEVNQPGHSLNQRMSQQSQNEVELKISNSNFSECIYDAQSAKAQVPQQELKYQDQQVQQSYNQDSYQYDYDDDDSINYSQKNQNQYRPYNNRIYRNKGQDLFIINQQIMKHNKWEQVHYRLISSNLNESNRYLFEPLRNFKSILQLHCNFHQSNFDSLKQLGLVIQNLQSLKQINFDFSQCKIRCISDFSRSLSKLEQLSQINLDISNTLITDISDLGAAVSNLELSNFGINASNNNINDLSVFAFGICGNVHLRQASLDFRRTDVDNLNGFQNLQDLRHLVQFRINLSDTKLPREFANHFQNLKQFLNAISKQLQITPDHKQ